MVGTRFDGITRALLTDQSRRSLVRRALVPRGAALTAVIVGGLAHPHAAEAKKLCRKNGSRCKKKGNGCKAKYCRREPAGFRTPFTIEAMWGDPNVDYDTYLFVPNSEGNTDPFPYVDLFCRSGVTDCESDVYPYVCIDDSAPSAEVTTVRRLLPGVYECWIEVPTGPLDELKVRLRNADGQVLRSWVMPPNPFSGATEVAWHVFDFDGGSGHVTSVDQFVDSPLPQVFALHTDVCPY